jgi:hypothetical protein
LQIRLKDVNARVCNRSSNSGQVAALTDAHSP